MSDAISAFGTALQAVHDAKKADYEKQKTRMTKATQDFEAVFVGMLIKTMRKSMAGDNALFGNSSESKVYQEMMDETLAQTMSRTGSFGLAKAMARSIEKTLPSDPDKAPAPKQRP